MSLPRVKTSNPGASKGASTGASKGVHRGAPLRAPWQTLAAGALLALGAVSAGAANRKEPPSRPEQLALEGVHNAMQLGSCATAVERLNAGLKSRYPSVYLLAGTMYEHGICLKQDWDRAAVMYQQANDAGEPKGLLRLIAGLASGNRDRAAAMYWAQTPDTVAMPAECSAGKDLRADPDAYVAQLRSWPAGRLDACVYAVGVAAAIAGDVEYPSTGAAFSVYGRYRMEFNPSAATVDWVEEELRFGDLVGLSGGDDVRDRDSRKVKDSLRRHLEENSQRALRRFTRPADVPTGWRVRDIYAFNIVG